MVDVLLEMTHIINTEFHCEIFSCLFYVCTVTRGCTQQHKRYSLHTDFDIFLFSSEGPVDMSKAGNHRLQHHMQKNIQLHVQMLPAPSGGATRVLCLMSHCTNTCRGLTPLALKSWRASLQNRKEHVFAIFYFSKIAIQIILISGDIYLG